MSRFAPQGARPAVQTARVHAELGIPAVLPTLASSQPTSGCDESAGGTYASTATPAVPIISVPEAAEPNEAVSPPFPDAPQRMGDGPDASQRSSGGDASPGLQNLKEAGGGTGMDGIAAEDGGQPTGWKQLLQLAGEATEPPRQLPQQLQEPPATPLQALAYSRQQFEHPGMTPFPGQAGPSWEGTDSDDEPVKEASPSEAHAQEPSLPHAKQPALGPPGHTPFPHLPAESPASSAEDDTDVVIDDDEMQAHSIRPQGAPPGQIQAVEDKQAHSEKQAHAAVENSNPLPLHMLMQHLQGGSYDSPTANRPLKFAADSPPDSSPATPPAQVTIFCLVLKHLALLCQDASRFAIHKPHHNSEASRSFYM